MPQPNITEMENRSTMNEGFQKQRSVDFLVEKEFADNFKQYCHPNERNKPYLINREFSKELQLSDISSGNILTLTGHRDTEALLNLTPQQQQQVALRGRTIVKLDTLHDYYTTPYDRESAEQLSNSEERVMLTHTL